MSGKKFRTNPLNEVMYTLNPFNVISKKMICQYWEWQNLFKQLIYVSRATVLYF